ncbi:hypothetical protein DFJ73DRAFT_832788 [Zopfochytrium polystomum]|nr:hypothetical protein DFJ73DRAFT_832788 [Zopfochytrium polystomum]
MCVCASACVCEGFLLLTTVVEGYKQAKKSLKENISVYIGIIHQKWPRRYPKSLFYFSLNVVAEAYAGLSNLAVAGLTLNHRELEPRRERSMENICLC